MLTPSRCKRHATKTLWAIVVTATVACGGDDEVPVVPGVIDREAFIEVYLDLRLAGVRGPELTVAPEARDRILTEHGIDRDRLLGFIDAYGGELDYMNELWAEIERRYEALPPEPRIEAESGA